MPFFFPPTFIICSNTPANSFLLMTSSNSALSGLQSVVASDYKEQVDFDDLSSFLIEEETVLLSQGKVHISGSSEDSNQALAS